MDPAILFAATPATVSWAFAMRVSDFDVLFRRSFVFLEDA